VRPTAIPYQLLVRFRRARRERRGHLRLVRTYRSAAGRGSLVFDVGANLGEHVELLRSLGCRVVAVEPQPRLAARLQEHYARDDEVVVVPSAVGAAPGTGQLQLSDSHVLASMSSEFRDATGRSGRFGDAQWTETIDVPITTLDALIAEHGVPSLCKIDVEGFEREVLNGLSTSVDAILFEYTQEVIDVAIDCLLRLAEIATYEYGLVLPEAAGPPRRWLAVDDAVATLRALPPGAYGDLYARRAG
jgi:FkbM family methyltransferase